MIMLNYAQPHKVVGTIVFVSSDGKENNPFWRGLGIYTDKNGIKWDVRGIIGAGNKLYVQARQVDDLPIYRTDSAAMFQGYSATWKPYYIEIVEKRSVR